MFTGLKRHLAVAKEAWSQEKKLSASRKAGYEQEFLPAALEVMERPANPVGRLLVWMLVLLFMVAMVWSWFGHVDTVANAHGKIALRGNSKSIQSSEMGVVRAIHVRDGAEVREGDILIELDPTLADADAEQAEQQLLIARTASARAQALYDYSLGKALSYVAPEGISNADKQTQLAFIESRQAEYEAKMETIYRQKQELRADISGVKNEISKLTETLPLLEKQMAARKELLDKGLSPALLYIELQERHVTHKMNIEIQGDQLTKLMASYGALESQLVQVQQEFRNQVISDLADAEDQVKLYTAELNKAQRRGSLQILRSPVDGIVQQLAVHTIGGVVQPAEPLMVIVPGKGDLIADAVVLNKDVGSISVGDAVEVKLEAFPFTKHGVIHGRLETLSMDAIQDENLGLVYAARIALEANSIRARGRDIPLTSGMSLTAEIKTGKRRILEFLIEPLLRYRDEALRER